MVLTRMTGEVALPEWIPPACAASPVLSRYTTWSHAGDRGGHCQGRRVLGGSGLDRGGALRPVSPTAVPRLPFVRLVPPRNPDRRSAVDPGAKAPQSREFVVRSARREGLLLAGLLDAQGADAEPLEVRGCARTGLPHLPVVPGRSIDCPECHVPPGRGYPRLSGRRRGPGLSHKPGGPSQPDHRTIAASRPERYCLVVHRHGRSDLVVPTPCGHVSQGDPDRVRAVSPDLHDRPECARQLRLEHPRPYQLCPHHGLPASSGLLGLGGLGAPGRSGGGAGPRPGPRATDELARGGQAPCSG